MASFSSRPLDSKQIHEQLQADSDSFSKFCQDSGIDIFDHTGPDGEISGPNLSDSCSYSDDGQARANVGGCGGTGGGGSGSGGYNDEDNDNEEYHLPGYNTVQSIDSQLTFRKIISPPSSRSNKPGKIPARKLVASRVLSWPQILD
jgi:hypothetical protein